MNVLVGVKISQFQLILAFDFHQKWFIFCLPKSL